MSATTAAVTECAGLSCVTKLGGPRGSTETTIVVPAASSAVVFRGDGLATPRSGATRPPAGPRRARPLENAIPTSRTLIAKASRPGALLSTRLVRTQ